ncbi:response regulator transcription factor [Oscillospiraceae bacterium 38-13]|jgi:DNA-binding NarL/FixJ family response regulator
MVNHKIKLIIVDDHAMVASGLAAELRQQPDFDVANVVTNPAELLKSIEDSAPDVLLMDIRMGVHNGIRLTEQIKGLYPEIKIVLMSGYNMGQLAKGSKADAFASKEEPIHALAATIRKVCLEAATVFPSAAPFEERLTDAETRVLQLLGEDLTRKEIAAALYISEKTVANHITAILQKLNVRSRIGAVLKGAELGLIDNSAL